MQFHAFDRHYLEQLASGDFRTQEHFVSYFSELIRLKLSKRLHSHSEVEDARQATFARVFSALRKPDGVREPERLGAYVNSCVTTFCWSITDPRRKRLPATMKRPRPTSRPSNERSGCHRQPANSKNVREILDELQEKDRRLIKEVFLEERDKDDVCRDLGVDREYLRELLHGRRNPLNPST